MQQKQRGLDFVMKGVSVRINKSPDEIEPFFQILKSNWYDTEQSLQGLTIADFQKMKVPHRVAQAIIDEVQSNLGSNKNNRKEEQKVNGNGKQNIQSTKKIVLNQMTMMNLTQNLTGALMGSLSGNRYQVRSIIQIIYKLISNIIKDPYQMKYRILKKSNNMIKKNVIQNPPCLSFMQSVGFEDSGETLVLNVFQVPQLIFLQDCLNQSIIQLGGQNLQENVTVPKKSEERMFLDVTKFPTSQSQVKQQFSQQKLSEIKYVDALQKLVEFRTRMMSQPPKNRRIRIYHKRFEQKNYQPQEISFQQQFSKSDDQAIVGYWKQIVSNNMRAQKFQSKRKLEFQYLLKQKIHKETLIKIKLPNELIIQAHFGPLEKLKQVFKVVADIIVGNLYLFTAPPKKIMDEKQMQKTLFQLDAVPMGSFYLSATDDVFYIQQQYAQYIQK